MSERRACRIVGCPRIRCGIVPADRTILSCGLGCGPSRMSAGALATDACLCCYDGRASSGCSGPIGTSGLRCVVEAGASYPWERAPGTTVPQLHDRWSLDLVDDQFIEGRRMRTSSWRTTAPANAWRLSPTPRSPVCGSPASSIDCSANVARLRPSSATTDTELPGNGILRWADDHNVAWHCARQADAERFRRKLHRPLGRVPRPPPAGIILTLPNSYPVAIGVWRSDAPMGGDGGRSVADRRPAA